MELLLLISALLSTLTGAISGVRAPEMQLHRASIETVAAAPLAAVRRVQLRPLQPALRLVAVAGMAAGSIAWSVASAVPLYADRLRE